MLIRIVKMHFRKETAPQFLKIFADSKDKIREFPGCLHLELLEDYSDPVSFTTYSHWVDETALNNYRESPLFIGVWEKTRVLFAKKACAFSTKRHTVVD